MAGNVVEEWVMVMRMATMEDSPFKGMVDLTGIFDEPLAIQQAVFDALDDEDKEALARLYGPKGANA